jgi:hypothetical protein
MAGENIVGNAIMGLLRASRNPIIQKTGQAIKGLSPHIYEQASNFIDSVFDPEKAVMEYYAKEFNPSPRQIESLQDVRDFVGNIGSIPMAPPFLGQGSHSRGYVPETKFTLSPWGMSGMGSMGNMYDPYLEAAVKQNAGMKAYEQSENQAAKRPFDDWQRLHEAVQNRHNGTMDFQARLRKDPKIIAASKGDPKLMAQLIHKRTVERNRQPGTFNAGDYLRFYINNNPLEKYGSLKVGPEQQHSLELPDMTGRRPYIIR